MYGLMSEYAQNKRQIQAYNYIGISKLRPEQNTLLREVRNHLQHYRVSQTRISQSTSSPPWVHEIPEQLTTSVFNSLLCSYY
jgi:hypothetical protein